MHHSSTVNGGHVGQSVGRGSVRRARSYRHKTRASQSKSCADRPGECEIDRSLQRHHTATHNVCHETPPGCRPDRQVVLSPQSSR
eukprot:1967434-Pleurochrysis_carterae.AAC.1